MLKQMFNQMKEVTKYGAMHVRNEKGQGMVEYALIIGLVAVALIVVLGFLGDGIGETFNAIIDELPGGGGEE